MRISKIGMGVVIFQIFFLISCGPKIVFQGEKNISEGIWNYDNVISYRFNIVDTTMLYDLTFYIDHDRSFRYENIYLKIKTVFPDKQVVDQEVSVDLLDANASWIGNCKGNDCLREVVMQESFAFSALGKYEIAVQQWSREQDLAGINAVGLRISESM